MSDRMPAWLRVAAGLAAAALLAACPSGTDDLEPYDVAARGPYFVGYQQTTITYQPEGDDAPREIYLAYWYPTEETAGTAPRYQGLIYREEVLLDAPVAPVGEAPVLVFSHGMASFAEQSWFLVEHFASHGFLVVAPNHPGSTLMDGFEVDPRSGLYRPLDISAVLDHLEALPASDPLSALVSDRIVLAGHSFGGYTTLAVSGAAYAVDALADECEAGEADERFCAFVSEEDDAVFREGFHDPRVLAGIPLTPAGGSIFRDGVAEVAVPQMVMTGAQDITTPNETEGDPIFEGLVGEDHIRLDFDLADHLTFSNVCEAFGPAVPEEFANCDEAHEIIAEDSHPVIAAYALAFARRHLLGDRSNDDLLDGTRIIGSDFVLSTKGP
jgi:predicted dienelactone hydrolase